MQSLKQGPEYKAITRFNVSEHLRKSSEIVTDGITY